MSATTRSTALARVGSDLVDPETGEVLAVAKHDPAAYLASLQGAEGLRYQHALAAAYDAAVLSLIGPNDVQEAEGRSFKKKSAWRKLARHFGISSQIVKIDTAEMYVGGESHFLATVTARAVAPWGQSYEEVGACCTDEATGRRTISVADAIATASTRASNRAISNLIAMGEVSAEEMNGRPARTDGPRRSAPGRTAPRGVPVMPFGRTKGKAISELAREDVESAVAWAREKGKFTDFADAAEAYLARAGEPEAPATAPQPQAAEVQDGPPPGFDDFAPADDDSDSLPF